MSLIDIQYITDGPYAGIKIDPLKPASGRFLVLHGYGGCKEEMLALSVHMAAGGFPILCPDLPGHGESGTLLFDHGEVKTCISYWQERMGYGFMGALGHSIGGRLALSLGCALAVAISAPFSATFGEGKKEMVRILRPRRVKEYRPFSGLLDIMGTLGEDLPDIPGRKLLLVGENDIAAAKLAFEMVQSDSCEIKKISGANHYDILTSGTAIDCITSWLSNHTANGTDTP
ncbi:MAG: alpha/beta hydrolase [Pseudomonadota bacterium]